MQQTTKAGQGSISGVFAAARSRGFREQGRPSPEHTTGHHTGRARLIAEQPAGLFASLKD
jgi:hypothetical protein